MTRTIFSKLERLLRATVLGLLLGLLCGLLYWPTLQDLFRDWFSNWSLSNGFLAAFISAFMIWMQRSELSRLPINGRPVLGATLLCLAGLLLVVGEAGTMTSLGALSLIFLIWGLVETFLGRAHSRALSFPIGFLLFAVPIIGWPMKWLNPPLQIITAWIAAVILNALGFWTQLDGNLITFSSGLSLRVDPGCSGAQLLVSMLALGSPLAYLLLTKLSNRSLVLSVVLGMAVLTNGLRVAAMGMWARFGGDVSTEPFHTLEGIIVDWVGYSVLIAGAWHLSRRERLQETRERAPTGPVPSHVSQSLWQNLGQNCIWPLAILLATGTYIWTRKEFRKPPAKDFHGIPSSIRGWRAIDGPLPFTPFSLNEADHDLLKKFESNLGEQVYLYIGYYESQCEGKELPDPSSLETNVVPIQDFNNQPAIASRARVTTKSGDWQVLFWYDINGSITPSRTQAKLLALRNKLIYKSNNAAMVVVSSPLTNMQERDTILESQRAFIKTISPLLKQYLPS